MDMTLRLNSEEQTRVGQVKRRGHSCKVWRCENCGGHSRESGSRGRSEGGPDQAGGRLGYAKEEGFTGLHKIPTPSPRSLRPVGNTHFPTLHS